MNKEPRFINAINKCRNKDLISAHKYMEIQGFNIDYKSLQYLRAQLLTFNHTTNMYDPAIV